MKSEQSQSSWDAAVDEELQLRITEADHSGDMRPDCYKTSILKAFEAFDREAEQIEWRDLRQRHFTLFEMLERATVRDASLDPDLLRAYWHSIEIVLRLYQDDQRKTGLGDVLHLAHREHLPLHIVAELQRLAGNLATGRLPRGLEQQHRPPMPPEHRKLIGVAVAYRMACRPEGLATPHGPIRFADSSPTKTLVQWYGTSKGTVQMWARSHAPHNPYVQKIDGQQLADAAKSAGVEYRQTGSSQQALLKRERKRQAAK